MACNVSKALEILDTLAAKPVLNKKKEALLAVRARIKALGAAVSTMNVEIDNTNTRLNIEYAALVADTVALVNKITIDEDGELMLKYLAQGLEGYIGGQYDPGKNTIKIAIQPTLQQAIAAANEAVDSRYYQFIEDKQIADEDLYTYMNNDPVYAKAKAEVPKIADAMLQKVSEIIKNDGLHAVTHEFVHAGAANFMKANPNHVASKRIMDIFVKVQHPRHRYKFGEARVESDYWKKNVDEFLAEALSNPKVMIALSNIKLTYGDKLASALNWLVDAAMKMLGFKRDGSAYEFVLDGFAALIEAQKEENKIEDQDPTRIGIDLKQGETKTNNGKITAEYISKELPQLSVEQVEELVQLLKELPVEAAKASIDKLRHCI